jgi:hypothetical protein
MDPASIAAVAHAAAAGPSVTFDLVHVTLSLGDLAALPSLIAKAFCALPFVSFC